MASTYRAVTIGDPWYGSSLAARGSRLLPRGQSLEAALLAFPPTRLDHPTPGRDVPFAIVLDGIIQHTIWHAGQIAMLRSVYSR